jgi:hypothetical protein
VLSRARRIESKLCRGPGLELSLLSVLTNPDVAPDLGYSERPLLAGLGVTRSGAAPRVFTHLEQRSALFHGDDVAVELASGLGLSRVELRSGTATLTVADGKNQTVPVTCETRLDYAEPRELLRSFLGQSPPLK